MGKFLGRTLLVVIGLILMGHLSYAVPSNSISIPNSFTPLTTALSALVNADFNECQSKFNAHTHTDITSLGGVTSGTWAASVIQPAYGGSGKDFSAIASGSVIYFSGTGTETTLAKGASGAILFFDGTTLQPNWLGQGTTNQVLQSNGTSQAPTWTTAGKVAQVVNNETGAETDCGTTIPSDDSTPLITEGTKVLTVNITPKSSSSKFKVDVNTTGSASGDLIVTAALYIDGASSVACTGLRSRGGGDPFPLSFSYYASGLTAASQSTLEVHCGGASGTYYFNGTASGVRVYGGSASSSLTVTEILP